MYLLSSLKNILLSHIPIHNLLFNSREFVDMSSHHSYIPWFSEDPDSNNGIKEAKEEVKTLRLCAQCNEFKQYILKDKNTLWLFFKCNTCDEIIKIPRERNRAAKKWEKEKWK